MSKDFEESPKPEADVGVAWDVGSESHAISLSPLCKVLELLVNVCVYRVSEVIGSRRG